MEYVVIKTLNDEALRMNRVDALVFDNTSGELRCIRNKDEIIVFDLHLVSEINFVIPLSGEASLVVGSSLMAKEKEDE